MGLFCAQNKNYTPSVRRLSSKKLAKKRWQQRGIPLPRQEERMADVSLHIDSNLPMKEGSQKERTAIVNLEVDSNLLVREKPGEKTTAEVNSEIESDPLIEEGSHREPQSEESNNQYSDGLRERGVEGECRYIVNIAYLLEQMHAKFDNHDPLSICSFRDMVQTNLRRYGLQTQIFFQCRVCNFKDSIWTDRTDGAAMDINRSAVAGTIATGTGFAQLEELLASMSVPCMSYRTYRKYDMEMIAAFEKAAQAEMRQAGEIAKNHALERGDFIIHDSVKIPFITVVADCSWMKRSYKSGKYDSLSGVGAIVDQHTNKVLFIGVRNKYCCICEWATKHEVTPKVHVCFKNWGRDQASTGMESDALLEGFQKSIETHGLIYKTLLADGDSSVYKTIVDNDPYSKYGVIVEKKECVNHLLRNLARKIRDVEKTKGRKIARLKKLAAGTALKFREAVEKAILHRQKDEGNDSSKINLLKNDVLNLPYHVFGDHRKCVQLNGFCHQKSTDEGMNVVEELKRAGLFQQLEDAITYLSFHADSLLYNATNNIAESFNAIVCKLIGGKRINFGQRGSFQARCAGSVLQHNPQRILTKLHESEEKKPPSTATALETRRQRKVRNEAELRKTRKASKALSGNKNRKRGLDKNYGPNAERLDIPAGAYDDLLQLHNDRLLENQRNRSDFEINTRGQADNPLWQGARRKILTASNFGEVCRMRETTSCSATVTSILYPTVKTTPAMVWGRTNEAKAIEELQTTLADEGNPVTIKPCGLFIDPILEFLGASPDGIINDTTIVEVKCPKSAQTYHPENAIRQGVTEIPKYFDRNDPSKMNIAHHYYYQVQGQLHITRADTCYFAVWSPLGLKYVKVLRDDTFWKTQMEPYLTRFYKECLLPEIIDPRQNRNMPIREPEYILEARQSKSYAVNTSKTGERNTNATSTLDLGTTIEEADDGCLLHQTQSSSSESESEITEFPNSRKVGSLILSRTDPEDPDSWCVTSTDEELRFSEKEFRVTPLKLIKRTSGEGVSWIVSSSDEQAQVSQTGSQDGPRVPRLRLKRSSKRRSSWALSPADDEETAPQIQKLDTLSIAPIPRSSALTKAAKERGISNPWVVISDDCATESPNQIEIDVLESVNLNVKIEDTERDVLSQNSLLNDSSIDQFLSVIKETTQFYTATSLWLAHPRFIKPSWTSQDIHIIGGNANRHWRCLYFDGTQLFVYDSLGCSNYQSLQEEEKRFISLRYPNLKNKDVVFPPVQKQPDSFSCGVFAAAFATTVALSENPSYAIYSQNVMKLRNHLMRIIERKELFAFPSV